MNKLKYFITKWFGKKKSKQFEVRKIWIEDKYENVLIPTAYDNPKVEFIKEWLDSTSDEEAVAQIIHEQSISKLLDDYLQFSFSLLQSLKERGITINDVDTYKKYLDYFDIRVPGFVKKDNYE